MAANVSDLLGLRMDELMRVTIERGASDLHMSVGLPPMLRIDGRLTPTEFPKLSPDDTKRLIYSILTDAAKGKVREESRARLLARFERFWPFPYQRVSPARRDRRSVPRNSLVRASASAASTCRRSWGT